MRKVLPTFLRANVFIMSILVIKKVGNSLRARIFILSIFATNPKKTTYYEERSVHSARSEYAEHQRGDEPYREGRDGGLRHLLGTDGIPACAGRLRRRHQSVENFDKAVKNPAPPTEADSEGLWAVSLHGRYVFVT